MAKMSFGADVDFIRKDTGSIAAAEIRDAFVEAIMLVVAVALIDADGRVLMQRRRRDRAHGGLWEFPGGKIEPGETAQGAVIREIAEELGIGISAPALEPVGFACPPDVGDHDAGAGKGSPLILLFATRQWDGEPVCLEAEEIGWFAPEALGDLAMPPLDYPLARALLTSPFLIKPMTE